MENIIRMGNDYLRMVTIGSLGMFCQIMYERLLQGTGRLPLSMYTQGLGVPSSTSFWTPFSSLP